MVLQSYIDRSSTAYEFVIPQTNYTSFKNATRNTILHSSISSVAHSTTHEFILLHKIITHSKLSFFRFILINLLQHVNLWKIMHAYNKPLKTLSIIIHENHMTEMFFFKGAKNMVILSMQINDVSTTMECCVKNECVK